jgi:hypothetical protein
VYPWRSLISIISAASCSSTSFRPRSPEIALHEKSPSDVEGLLHPINRLNKALCGFDGLINEAHRNQGSEKVRLGRDGLIRTSHNRQRPAGGSVVVGSVV